MTATATTDGINTAWGFRATKNADGSLTIHDVPVFVTCQRGEHEFGEGWLDTALERAKQAEGDGYLPPLHVRHHDKRGEVGAAGVFRLTGKRRISFKGTQRPALMADLIVTNPAVVADVMAKRLPYRSVEIFDVDAPNIDSLALLDHEAPFLELPLLIVRNVNGGDGVAPATFSMERRESDDGVVVSFRRGQHVQMLMEANTMKPEGSKDGDEKPKGESKDGEKGGCDVAAVVAAIKSGSISVKDFGAIKDAMAAQESGASGEKPPDATKDGGPAPAAAPGASMKREDGAVSAEQFGRVAAQAEASAAELAKMRAERAQESDVSAAVETLKGRALGANVRDRLLAFHREHGAKAFGAYVKELETTAPKIGDDGGRKAADFAGSGSTLPAIAMKFQKDGPEAVERAAKFAREHAELVAGGYTRTSLERYVEINMAGGAKAIVK